MSRADIADRLDLTIGVHAAAALLHHYVLRDGAMARMLPVRFGA